MEYKYNIHNWREWLPTMLKQATVILIFGLVCGLIIGTAIQLRERAIDDSYSKGWLQGWRDHTEYTNEWLIKNDK